YPVQLPNKIIMSISHKGCLIPLGCRRSGTDLIASIKFIVDARLRIVERDRTRAARARLL
ncbi:hypothetical protein, partial [Microcoleus sp. Z1_C3]|uniref:hypothetical protein n=1 Tax=Microcoleus sp. Z1_C3 TaxID=3055431 RepID=UPI002FD67B7E